MTIKTERGVISVQTGPVEGYGHSYPPSKNVEQARARVLKGLEYLGPWCANCGRKGKTCRAGSKACRQRALTRAFKGCNVKAMFGLSLPAPPMDWLLSKGYASDRYYAGGVWRDGGTPRVDNWLDMRELAQEYAYEVAIGKAA